FVGFFLVARFWINHHRIFQSAGLSHERALSLNLAHLFFISLTPYTASLIGHYQLDRVAEIILCSNLGLCALALTVLGHYVVERTEPRHKDAAGTVAQVHCRPAFT